MRRAAHNGCCCRVAQTRALCSVLWKLLISEGLVEVLMNIEIPLVKKNCACYVFSEEKYLNLAWEILEVLGSS